MSSRTHHSRYFRVQFVVEQLEPRQLLAGAPTHKPTHGPTLDALTAGAPIPPALAERLARGVAYDDGLVVGTAVVSDGVTLPYTVAKIFKDLNTGFDGVGVISDQYGPAFLTRGTEPETISDLIADANPSGVGYGQFSKNWIKVKSWLSTLHVGIDFIGHSLGGALAQWFSTAWSIAPHDNVQSVDQVFTFEAAGISNNRTTYPNLICYADQFDNSRVRSVEHYIVLGDLVVMAGEQFITGNVFWSNFSTLNLVDKHLLPQLNAAIGARPRPVITATGTMTSAQLSDPAYVHNDKDYFTIVMILQIVANGLSIVQNKPALRAIPSLMLRRDTCEATRKTIGEFLGAAQNKFQVSLSPARIASVTLLNLPALYTKTKLVIDTNTITFTLTGNPPTLSFNGGIKLSLAQTLEIPLPPFFPGGPIEVEALVTLANFDFAGALTKTSLKVAGTLNMLGSLATVNGLLNWRWSQNDMVVSGDTNFLNGFVTTAGSTTITGDGKMHAEGDANVNIPNGVKGIGGTNIGSGHMVFNFDPSNLGGSYIEGVGTSFPFTGKGLRVYLDGDFKIIGFNFLPRLFIRGTEGATFDIPTGEDWLMMQAAWENDSSSTQLMLTMPGGTVLTEADILARPDMQILPELSNSKRRTVYIEHPAAGSWSIRVDDPAGLGNIEYNAAIPPDGVAATMDPLTGGAHRAPVQIKLHVVDPSHTAIVSLYYDLDGAGDDATLIANNLAPDASGIVNYNWDVSSVPAGVKHVFAVITTDSNPSLTVYAPNTINITETQPIVTGSEFAFETGQAISVTFDQDVSLSADLSDFTLTNLTSGQTVSAASLSFAYDALTDTITITSIDHSLTDGNYRLSAPASSITNAGGDELAGDVSVNFFVLAGDLNRDRHVNAVDQSILTTNLENYGTFSDGDVNYDGFIDAADQAIMTAQQKLWLPPQGIVAVPTTSGNDDYRLRRETDLVLDIYLAADVTPTYRLINGTVRNQLSIDDVSGGHDNLVLDYTNGRLLPAGDSIDWNGGPGADSIAVIGSPGFEDVAFAGSITVMIDGLSSLTSVSGVEHFSFDGGGGFDDLQVTVGNAVVLPTTQFLNDLEIGGAVIVQLGQPSGLGLYTRGIAIDDSSGSLDLNDNDLIVDHPNQLTAVQQLINAGRSGGTWNGFGIKSFSASEAFPRNTTLGAMLASDFHSIYGPSALFDGQAIDGDAVLVKYTYYGDTDFNGTVNFDDYSRTDAGFNQGKSGWLNGDFDGNGHVDFDDYSLIDLAFNTQG